MVDRHRAMATAGEPMALRINAVLDGAGCAVGLSGPRETRAVAAMRKALDGFGDTNTSKALKTLRAAWADDRNALRGGMILALAGLFARNNGVRPDKVAKAIGAHPSGEVVAMANRIRLGGDSPDMAMRIAISNLYTVKYPTSGLYVRDAE